VRNEAAADGSGPARESIWQYFVNKCANNLHIALPMSPVGDLLRTRCRNFPGAHPKYTFSPDLRNYSTLMKEM